MNQSIQTTAAFWREEIPEEVCTSPHSFHVQIIQLPKRKSTCAPSLWEEWQKSEAEAEAATTTRRSIGKVMCTLNKVEYSIYVCPYSIQPIKTCDLSGCHMQ